MRSVSYTISYYDLVNDGYFTPPTVWASPDWPAPEGLTFEAYFMARFGSRQIASETIPGFTDLMAQVTAEVQTFLPTLEKINREFIDDSEERTTEWVDKHAPGGATFDASYNDGGHKVVETNKGAASGDINRAWRIMLEGKPVFQIVADKYEACFLSIW